MFSAEQELDDRWKAHSQELRCLRFLAYSWYLGRKSDPDTVAYIKQWANLCSKERKPKKPRNRMRNRNHLP